MKIAVLLLVPAILVVLLSKWWMSPSKPKHEIATATATPLPPEASPVPVTGSLRIESKPAGAKIFIDNTDTERQTPATVDGLPINQRMQLKLVKEGYETETKQIIVRETEEVLPVFTLNQILATLTLHITPSDAAVYLNGKERGDVIEEIPVGRKYTLKVMAPGYRPYETTIVPKDRKEDLTIALKQISMGTISFGADPWATVFVDGKEAGETPIAEYKLTVGKHTIEFRHQNYKSVVKRVQIKTGKNPNIIVKFSD